MTKPYEVIFSGVLLGITCACGAPVGDRGSDSLAEALANLPEDTDARGTMLDALNDRYAGDELLGAAIREFERDMTPGLLQRVEFEDGRFVSFIEAEGGGLVVVEGGSEGQSSVIEQLGLATANSVELWEALTEHAPVPEVVASSAAAEAYAHAWSVASTSEVSSSESLSYGGGQPYGASGEVNGEIGVVRQAYTSNEDAFLADGACALRPSPGAVPFANVRPGSPLCVPGWGNGAFGVDFAVQMRVRVASYSGGGFHVRLTQNGSPQSQEWVSAGQWRNFRQLGPRTTKSWCCGTWGSCWTVCSWSGHVSATLRFDVLDASNDGFHIAALWFDHADSRSDTQPW
ncbi:MAG TPA: hypothetical protein VGB13_10370 [Candidatus Krumholzibacteria bacterium]|jgi:hypothetical protein